MKYILFLLLFILYSCTSDEEKNFKQIEDIWLIEKIVYKNQDITKEFYVNTLTFEKGNNSHFLVIPRTETHEAENALIKISSKNDSTIIQIESVNKKIRGSFIMNVKTDLDNFTILELRSRNGYFKLKKMPTVAERLL